MKGTYVGLTVEYIDSECISSVRGESVYINGMV